MTTTQVSPLSHQLVVFSLGSEEYALPITQVQEIIRYTEPRSVGSHIESVRGVISLRGGIVSVYDLATRLGVAPSPLSGETKIVITEYVSHGVSLKTAAIAGIAFPTCSSKVLRVSLVRLPTG